VKTMEATGRLRFAIQYDSLFWDIVNFLLARWIPEIISLQTKGLFLLTILEFSVHGHLARLLLSLW
jgi:hypothetical protein